MMTPERPSPPPYDAHIWTATLRGRCGPSECSSVYSKASYSRSMPSSSSSISSTSSRKTAYNTPYPNSFASGRQEFTSLPKFALFDPRPSQNLLGDLEIIFGKELKFPFIGKFARGKKERKEERISRPLQLERVSGVDEMGMCRGSKQDGDERATRKLRKPSDLWDGDFVFDQACPGREKKGRGVREGNWI